MALFGNISITTSCIQELLRKGIPVSYFSKKGTYFSRLESTSHKNIFRLKKQIAMNDSDDFSLKFAKKIISAKINNQTVLLNRYDKNKITSELIDLMKKMKNMRKYKVEYFERNNTAYISNEPPIEECNYIVIFTILDSEKYTGSVSLDFNIIIETVTETTTESTT